ncbi:MAG: Flp family type IVb pilin [Planctomycetota bacterium]|jgi:Flp pilus assembly pilin Flp
MSHLLRSLTRLARDDAGQTTIEYALLIAVIGLPAITVFGWLLKILATNYQIVTFLELLPFP